MKLYPEMFLSIWHLAVPILVLIALIAMLVGGYDKRTILKSTGSSLLIFYCIVTLPVGLITQQNMYREDTMTETLDLRYEERKESLSGITDPGSYIMVHVGAFKDDESTDVLVFAGNYHESESFTGTIHVKLFDKDGQEVFTETYESVTLQPGEKKKIDKTFTSQPMEKYQYEFNAQSR